MEDTNKLKVGDIVLNVREFSRPERVAAIKGRMILIPPIWWDCIHFHKVKPKKPLIPMTRKRHTDDTLKQP